MDIITNKCTGCGMCEKLCPKNAISLRENKEGFLEPFIDNKKCINCGLCKKRCPQNSDVELEKYKQKVYAVNSKNKEIIKNSSSGGIFGVIANYVLENGGLVCGAAYDDNLVVKHIFIDNTEKLTKIQESKYVQSNTLFTFSECKKYLENNKKVLYCGTPCQIAGLKKYLNKDYDNLITIDLICHGVTSPLLFKKYIDYLEKKYKDKIQEYHFRTKDKNGWSLENKIVFKNKQIYNSCKLDKYYTAFLSGNYYREACYECKYANDRRIGDITIGDFWGIELFHKDFTNYKDGVSAVIINSKKGQQIFNSIKKNINYVESSIDKVKKKNHNLNMPTIRQNCRNDVYKNIHNENYIKKELKIPFKNVLKSFIPSSIKDSIKSIFNKEK